LVHQRIIALPGVDFLITNGIVTFAAGESIHAISLQLLDNQQLDDDRTVRLRLTALDGRVLRSVIFAISNDDFGFLPEGSYAFSNGRLTGYRTQISFRIQRSTDLLYWEDWTTPPSAAQIVDYEASTESGRRQFYRLVKD